MFLSIPQLFNISKVVSKCLLKLNVQIYSFQNFAKFSSSIHSNTKLFALQKGTQIGQLKRGAIQDHISSLQLKKRTARKKRLYEDEVKQPGLFSVTAYTTAEEYNLEKLIKGLLEQDLYEPRIIEHSPDVLHAVAKYQVEKEPRQIFFFREGSVVLWNVTELESSNILAFLKLYETDSYSDHFVQDECEIMNYKHQTEGKPSAIEKDGNFLVNATEDTVTLDKYTFSNALVLSVKLGAWESSLEKYIDSIEFVTEDLKLGRKIKMTREEVLRKHGELFALRHLINLSSDLLDTPDFYWENEQLETLYLQICAYFNISKRTRVMNEKINHCVELIELLSSHLSDKHHIRLEWMIIILIMVEVAFETIHYIDRFMTSRIAQKADSYHLTTDTVI